MGDKTCVYQYDPKTKQKSLVWLFPDERSPVKFKRLKGTSKQMITVIFTKLSHVASVPLPERLVNWFPKTTLGHLGTNHTFITVLYHQSTSKKLAHSSTQSTANESIQNS